MSKQQRVTREVSEGFAYSVIAQQFPSLEPIAVELIGSGFDNTVFRVNNEYLFRFPSRQEAVALLQQEWDVLPHVASCVSLTVPEPLFLGKPTDTYPWPFIGYKFVPGRDACKVQLTREQRSACASSLGAFLQELHSISGEEALKHGAVENKFSKSNRAGLILEKLPLLKDLGYTHLISKISHVLEGVKNAQLPDDSLVFVHNDLYAAHLIFNDRNKLSGVIDWGYAHIDSVSVDLKIIFSFLPRSSHADFFASYGASVRQDVLDYALLRALYTQAVILSYSLDARNEQMVKESIMGFELLAEHAE